MDTTLRRITAAAAITSAALLAAALPFTHAVAGASTVGRCLTPNLHVSLSHPVSTGGSTGWTLRAVNEGRGACAVRGYPVVTAALAGQPVHTRERHGATMFAADPGPSVTVLAPGASVVAHLAYGTTSGPGAPAVRAGTLRVRTRRAVLWTTVGLPPHTQVTDGLINTTAWEATP